MNDQAKSLWDTAIHHLEAAAGEQDCALSDSYVRIGELALKAAQFAIDNRIGEPEIPDGLPVGSPPLPEHMRGPKVWGA